MATSFFDKLFSRYPVKTKRALEILPGVISWTLILFPLWGSFFFPIALAYFVLFFDVYWFYKSFSLVITAFIASRKIEQAESINWLQRARKLEGFKDTIHVVVIPNYQESLEKLRETLRSMQQQTFPSKQILVVLAMEKREGNAREKADELQREFKDKFFDVFATFHPDIEGEVKGKSSNQAFAARETDLNYAKNGRLDIENATISSVDADSIFDKQYFSYLTFSFLSDPKRHSKFWQSANVNFNNFWKVPAPVRVISFFGSLWRTGVLVQGDRLIANSTYSLSFKLLREIDYWDTDVVPEDYRIFFKAFYKKQGNVWVEPIFLKTSMDAPQSRGFLRTLKNKYHQEQRWSWGVSDDPLFIKWWLTVPGVPFFRKTIILYNVLLDHFLWPVNWFILTVAANIIPFINPAFARTTLGYNLSQIAGLILTSCLLALFAMVFIHFKSMSRHGNSSRFRQFLFPLEFILLPVVGFFFGALPAIISHTKLMLGKRIEYKVTEKI